MVKYDLTKNPPVAVMEWFRSRGGLAMDGMDAKIHGGILCDAAPAIHEDTLIVIDPTDIQKTLVAGVKARTTCRWISNA